MPASELYAFASAPGVHRDGTDLDSPHYHEGIWTRWQRGRPRKMGGYRATSRLVNGTVRSVHVDVRAGVNSAHFFSQWGVQRLGFDANGSGNSLDERTPLGFSANSKYTWSHAKMFSSTGGTYTALLAASTPDVDDIASDATGGLYYGDVTGIDPMVGISDGGGPILVSGGLTVLQPFLFLYGSNGEIRNSNANDFSTATGWTTGGSNMANTANVAGTKIIYGAPLRGGGQSPAGLFWALDALIRVSFVGGTALWDYDTLSNPMSILAKNAVIEHDGKFFWPGIDRFLMYNGVIQEVPNQMNSDWFFDNLNYAHRNKVWGTKIPRMGEMWWFYPRGTDTECNDAVIFNYRENTWYDARLERSAGAPAQTFRFPIWVGAEDSVDTVLLKFGLRLRSTAATLTGAAVFTFTSTTGVANGMIASGHAGIPAGSVVTATTATTVTLDNNATVDVPSGTVLTFTNKLDEFTPGDLVTGGTSSAIGYVARQTDIDLNLRNVTGTFQNLEQITGALSGDATLIAGPVDQTLETSYQQEFGYDKIVGQDVLAIRSSFVSKDFGFAVGAPFLTAPKTVDLQTRVIRLLADLEQRGPLQVSIIGRDFPRNAHEVLDSQTLDEDSNVLDIRGQARILRLRVESNVIGGFYELGATSLELAPGDERSSESTP